VFSIAAAIEATTDDKVLLDFWKVFPPIILVEDRCLNLSVAHEKCKKLGINIENIVLKEDCTSLKILSRLKESDTAYKRKKKLGKGLFRTGQLSACVVR
jgi:hypothetical protein